MNKPIQIPKFCPDYDEEKKRYYDCSSFMIKDDTNGLKNVFGTPLQHWSYCQVRKNCRLYKRFLLKPKSKFVRASDFYRVKL